MSFPRAAVRFVARSAPARTNRQSLPQRPRHIARRPLTSQCSTRPARNPSQRIQINKSQLHPAQSVSAPQYDARRWHSAPSGPRSKAYDFNSVKQMIEEPSSERVLVDVREPSEYNDGFIPTAINIPVKSHPDAWFLEPDEFEDRFGFTKPSTTKELVFYCKAGVRSSAAAALAQQGGYDNVGEYRGSWLDWEEHGGPNSKPT